MDPVPVYFAGSVLDSVYCTGSDPDPDNYAGSDPDPVYCAGSEATLCPCARRLQAEIILETEINIFSGNDFRMEFILDGNSEDVVHV